MNEEMIAEFVYYCKNCKEEWTCTDSCEDYVCPFCSMPLWEAIRDIWKEEKFGGMGYILKIIKARFNPNHK